MFDGTFMICNRWQEEVGREKGMGGWWDLRMITLKRLVVAVFDVLLKLFECSLQICMPIGWF